MVRIHLGVLTYDDSTDQRTEFGTQFETVVFHHPGPVSRARLPALQSFGLHGVQFTLLGDFLYGSSAQTWYRNDRDAWFVAVAGTRRNLCPDKKQAMERFDGPKRRR